MMTTNLIQAVFVALSALSLSARAEEAAKTAPAEAATPPVKEVPAPAKEAPAPPKEAPKDVVNNPPPAPPAPGQTAPPKEPPKPHIPPACAHTTVFNSLRIDVNRVCPKKSRLHVYNHIDESTYLEVCRKDEKDLDMEGAAHMENATTGETFWLNWEKRGKYRRLSETQAKRCPFAYGSLDQKRRPICLDAMYALAADMAYYQPGDVIYFPGLDGMPIPEDYQVLGPTHDGYFVIRDVGEMIKGEDRFDIFSGFIHWSDPANPFSQRGYSDQKKCWPFKKIEGEEADKIRARLNYPNSLYTEKIAALLPKPAPAIIPPGVDAAGNAIGAGAGAIMTGTPAGVAVGAAAAAVGATAATVDANGNPQTPATATPPITAVPPLPVQKPSQDEMKEDDDNKPVKHRKKVRKRRHRS